MKLGPESRRQVGDNYEKIIFDILHDFGWTTVQTNFDIDVPSSVRKMGKQGIDGAFLYYDPSCGYDIGVKVESKKYKNLQSFRRELPNWLESIDSAIYYLNTNLGSYGFQELSRSSKVEVTEGLITVWIDEEYDAIEFRKIVSDAALDYLDKRKSQELCSMVHVIGNQKLRQLQAITSELLSLKGKYNLNGEFRFEYADLGPSDAPSMLMILNDIIFIRAMVDELTNKYHIVAFNLTDFSKQQLQHFRSCFVDIIGQSVTSAEGIHGYVWDMDPSEPEKVNLWRTMFQRSVESKYRVPSNQVTLQGFNRDYINISE